MAIFLNSKQIDLSSRFPDGTLNLKVDLPNAEERVTIRWNYEGEEELAALLYVTNHLYDHGVPAVHLILPYLPNARMDRTKHEREVFTLKYFCAFINALNFSTVTILDPHSSVGAALLARVKIVDPKPLVDAAVSIVGRDAVLFYPDEGAVKRYASLIGRPYAYGIKSRDWETGKINGLHIVGEESIIGRDVLIVDDICSRGGTFCLSAKALKDAGAKDVYLYVTHCENTILDGDLLKGDLVKYVCTTNSIFTAEHDKIIVLRLKE